MKSNYRFGFTLIELLVTIAIVGILSVVILVTLNSVREDARLAKAIYFETQLRRNMTSEFSNQIGLWTFFDSENGDTVITDDSGTGFDLNISNSEVNISNFVRDSARDNQSVFFNGGTGNGISVNTSGTNSLLPNNEIVFSTWFYLPSDSALTASVFFRYEPDKVLLYTRRDYLNTLCVQVGANADTPIRRCGISNRVKYDTWQHAALLFGNNEAVLYLDGAEIGRFDDPVTDRELNTTNSSSFVLGQAWGSGSGPTIVGYMDDIFITSFNSFKDED